MRDLGITLPKDVAIDYTNDQPLIAFLRAIKLGEDDDG
jgi:hypothetical protein